MVFESTLPMSRLYYLNLDLFIYHLREGLGDQQEDIKKNHETFWANLPKELQNSLASDSFAKELEAEDTEYLELLPIDGQAEAHYYFKEFVDEYPVKGYYYPVRLSETYGLLFDCYIKGPNYPQLLSSFYTLKHLAATKQGNLGKAWMISGCLPPHSDTEAKILDQKAYHALTAREWQQPNQGKFLGAKVFEVWRTPQKWESIEENIHVLIILYPNLSIAQKAAEFYEDWMRLFCYRNKIIWAYSQTRKLKRRLQNSYASIFETAETFKQLSLKELQATLQKTIETLSQYVYDINI